MTRARNSANLASQGNLFVDISNDRTGIGSVVPAQNLHVAGTAGFHADTTFVGDLYNATWDRSANKLVFDENSGIRLGNNNELQIDHRGTSYILNIDSMPLVIGSHNLQLTDAGTLEKYLTASVNNDVILYRDGSERLRTKDHGVNVTGTTDTDGLVVSGVATVTTMNVTGVLTYDDVTSVDSVGIVTARQGVRVNADGSSSSNFISVGASADLKLFHQSGHSRISNSTGILKLTAPSGSSVRIVKPDDSANVAVFHIDAETHLYYNGAHKFSTVSDGIQSVGNVTINDSIIHNGDTNTKIRFPSNDTISFETGGSERLRINSSGHLSLPVDNQKLRLGASGDLELFHNGSNSFIDNNTGNLYVRSSGGQILFRPNNSEDALVLKPDADVELYYNGSKKFETTANGALIESGTPNFEIYASTDGENANLTLIGKTASGGIGQAARVRIQAESKQGSNGASAMHLMTRKTNNTITTAITIDENQDINFPIDNQKLKLGASQDLQIYHDGSNSYISEGGTGDLIIQSSHIVLKDSGTQVFETTNSGIRLQDNNKLVLGSGNDLEIYHDGSHSFLDHSGAGNLYIRTLGTDEDLTIQAQNDVFIKCANGEDGIRVVGDGEVKLYHNAAEKLATTTSGINVTGNVDATGNLYGASLLLSSNAFIGDNNKLNLGTGNDLQIFHSGTHSFIENSTGILAIRSDSFQITDKSNNHAMITAAQDGAVELYYDNSKKAETDSFGFEVFGELRVTDGGYGNTHFNYLGSGNNYINQGNSSQTFFRNASGTVRTQIQTDGHWRWRDGIKAEFGDSDDLQIFHDGSFNKIIGSSAGNHLILRPNSADEGIRILNNAAVELYHNGSKKFETTSGGVQVTDNLNMSGGHIFVADNFKLNFGNSDDLQIYHSGSHSYIADEGAGELIISGSRVQLMNAARSGKGLDFVEGSSGYLRLYQNNNIRLETLSNGVRVVNQLFVSEGTINLEKSGVHHHRILMNDTGNDLGFQQSSATGANTNFTTYLRINDGGNISLPVDNQKLRLGASADLQIYHDGSNSFLDSNKAGGQFLIRTKESGGTTNNAAKFMPTGAVELYHDGTKRIETTSTGSTISGTALIADDIGSTQPNTFPASHVQLMVYTSTLGQPIDNTNCARLLIATDAKNVGAQGYHGSLDFGSSDCSASGGAAEFQYRCAAIMCRGDGDTSPSIGDGDLQFYTKQASGSLTHRFDIAPNGTLTGTDTNGIGSLSDQRLKTNIQDYSYDLNKFKQLKTRTFDWINPEFHDEGTQRGFIAQEIETVDPYWNYQFEVSKETAKEDYDLLSDGDEDYTIRDHRPAKASKLNGKDAMYVSVIQQLMSKVETLEAKVAALESS